MGTSNNFCEHKTHSHNLGVVAEYRDILYSELKGEPNKREQKKHEKFPFF